MRISDWSSDVCSSDLQEERVHKLSMKATAQQAITSNASAMNGGSSGAAGMTDRQPWHALGVEETVARMETRPDGLTKAEGVQRLKTYGRSEERRVGKEGVSTSRTGWWT